MNNFPCPIPIIPGVYNPIEEINYLKERIRIIEEKLKTLESKEESDYLKNDDNYYMI